MCGGILTRVRAEGTCSESSRRASRLPWDTRRWREERERERCCADRGGIPFLSPLPRGISDGLPGLAPRLCRCLAGDLGKSRRVSGLCLLLCKSEGPLLSPGRTCSVSHRHRWTACRVDVLFFRECARMSPASCPLQGHVSLPSSVAIFRCCGYIHPQE